MAAQWFTPSQLAALSLPGLPKTDRAIQLRARRENWAGRKRAARGGGFEYPVSSLPPEAQAALIGKALKAAPIEPAKPSLPCVPSAAILRSYQRQTMEARAALLAEIDRLVLEGFSQGRAINRLVELAAADELRPDLSALIPAANARAGNGRTLSRRSLYRWISERARAEGNALALAPAAPAEADIPVWAGPLMDFYARPSKPSLAWAVEELAKKLPDGGPSYDQARRFLARLNVIDRNAGRMGPRALKSFRAYVARGIEELWPTAVYVADGHTFDAEVAHPRHGRPFRPEVTTIIDVFTRRIVGWSVGLAENKWDVTAAAVNAFTTSGPCDIWYTDNGSGFVNQLWDDHLTGLIARLSITKKNGLPYNSQARGVIERSHRTVLVSAAKTLPTYMGAAMDGEARNRAFKVTRKDIRTSGRSRHLLDWAEFIELVAETIRHYNAHPHSTLAKIRDPETGRRRHQSPDEVWAEWIAKGWSPDVVPEAEAVDLFRPYEKRRTNRALVELFGNSYFAPELEGFHGEDVLVGYDTTDASRVWVRALDGRFIAVAKFEGNKRSFFPVSVAEQARERRAAGRLARLDAHRAEVMAELRPETLLEHQPSTPLPSDVLDLAAIQLEALTVPAEPEPQHFDAAGRPLFRTDVEWVNWLARHPDRVTDQDRSGLRDALRSPSFRMELEMNGVAATTLETLLEKAA